MITKSPVWFVGAGPGDPRLITLKGKELLETADCILYAGSLVQKEILSWAPPGCRLVNTASMTLEAIVEEMAQGWDKGLKVVRLHTGDPCLFGATMEQFRMLEERSIPFEVVPGVSAAFLCAAAMKRELTVPERTQTVIFTRARGRTPVPQTEDLERLSKIGATMAIYLSISRIDEVAKTLALSYGKDAPVVVGYRLSCPGERLIRGTLSDIASKVKAEGIERYAIIMVGPFLEDPSGKDATRSRLYDPGFWHGFRKPKE